MVLFYETHPAAYTHNSMFGNRHGAHPGSPYSLNALYSSQVPAANQYDFSPYPSSPAFASDHMQSQHQNPGSYFYDYRSAAAGPMDDPWGFGTSSSCNISMSSTGSSQIASPQYRNSPASNSSSMGADTYGQISQVPCGLFSSTQNYFSSATQHANHSVPVSSANISSVSGNGSSTHALMATPPRNPEKVTIKSEPISSPNAKSMKYDWMGKSSFQNHNHHSAPVSGKTRTKDKYRVVYSDHQRVELEREFGRHKYIDVKRKTELARALLLSERQVKIWFQNRRAKDRKQGKKRVDQGPVASRPGTQVSSSPSMHSGMTFRNSIMQPPHIQCPDRQYDHRSHVKMEN